MSDYHKSYNKKKALSIKKKLEFRNYDVIICDDVKVAQEKAVNMINPLETVGFGGSVTVEATGIIDYLHERKQPIFDRTQAKSTEVKNEMMKKSLTADYFLTSFNGISKDGEVVNIDGRGNRVAAITYGPDKVFAFVGINKVYGDLENTIETIRNHAAPLNVAKIGNKKTPCHETGMCRDCLSVDCICNTIVITRRSSEKGRITIFLILEELGF